MYATGAKTVLSLEKGGPHDVVTHVASPLTHLSLGSNRKEKKKKGDADPETEVLPLEREARAAETMAEDLKVGIGNVEESLGLGSMGATSAGDEGFNPFGSSSAAGASSAAGSSSATGASSSERESGAEVQGGAGADADAASGASADAGATGEAGAAGAGAGAGEKSAATGDSKGAWWENGDPDDESTKLQSVSEVKDNANASNHVPLIFTTDQAVMPKDVLDKVSEVLAYSVPLQCISSSPQKWL